VIADVGDGGYFHQFKTTIVERLEKYRVDVAFFFKNQLRCRLVLKSATLDFFSPSEFLKVIFKSQ
jgi:hypothetical protein